MSRRVVDDIVMVHQKYYAVSTSDRYLDEGYGNKVFMTSDKTPKLVLKQSTINVEFKLINPVEEMYNKIEIEDPACTIETPNGIVPVSVPQMKMLKALFSCTTSTSRVLAECCKNFSQHVLQLTVQKKQPVAYLVQGGSVLETKIYDELSAFYIDRCS